MSGFSQLAHTYRKILREKAPRVLFLFFACIALHLSAVANDVSSSVEKTNVIRANPFAKINEAFQNTTISRLQRDFLQAQYMFDQQSLPLEFRFDEETSDARSDDHGHVRCGFETFRNIDEHYAEYSSDQQSLLRSYSARPSLDTSVVSPGGFFRLHYDTIGAETVPVSDTNGNGRPDFIDRAAEFLDSAWNHYHVTLGYLLPPDDGVAGGDNKYDVYFLSVFGYGVTFFDGAGPEAWDDRKSYILMHRNFLGFAPNLDPEGSQMGALKATAVHEYFHAVQLAYDGSDETWMYESGATWQEEVLHPLTRDNHQFLPSFYNDPDSFLTTSNGPRMYGAFVWPGYLAEQYSQSLIRDIWLAARFVDGIAAVDTALLPYGSVTSDEFSTFTTWNFFTGSRAQAGHFPAAAEYPPVALDNSLPLVPFSVNAQGERPDGLGATYLPLPLSAQPPGILKLGFQGDGAVAWGLNLYFKNSLDEYEVFELGTGPGQDTSFAKFNYTAWDTLFVAPHVVTRWQNNNDFTLDAYVAPFGDADGSDNISIGDATYLIAYVFSGGAEPKIDLLAGDADCSGHISIADITYIIAHIFAGGPAPCPQ